LDLNWDYYPIWLEVGLFPTSRNATCHLISLGFDSCTTSIQQLHNNPSHEGGPQYVGPTLMWGIVVQLLYWCCKSNIFHNINSHRRKKEEEDLNGLYCWRKSFSVYMDHMVTRFGPRPSTRLGCCHNLIDFTGLPTSRAWSSLHLKC
jgi:hypothetical protein